MENGDQGKTRQFIDEILGAGSLGNVFQQPADSEGRIVCAGCGIGYPCVTDLRPWPPDQSQALRFCGGCRLAKALKH